MSDEYTSAGKWVVGTDGSLRGDKAVMWAAHHASERTVPVPVLILHCIREAPEPSAAEQDEISDALGQKAASLPSVPLVAIVGWVKGADSHVATSEEDARAVAEKLLAPKIAEFPQVEVKIKPPHGRPEDAIIEASRTAGLVVLGSRGQGGFAGLRLGPTTRHVLRVE